MSPALKLYEPINTLKPVAENIWIVDGPVIHMQMYRLQVPFTTRMTVVRLDNEDLFLHSPTKLHPALQEEIEALGTIKHLVSPNKIHYAHVLTWGEAYPDAIKWASPGVRERAKSVGLQVRFDRELAEEPNPPWATEIDQLVFQGSRFMEEYVFFHKASRTLILTDLIENFEAERVSRGWRLLVRLAGSMHPDGKAPLDLRMTFRGREKQAQVAVRQMLAWQPERVLLAHGRWYPANGVAELRRAFRWVGPLDSA